MISGPYNYSSPKVQEGLERLLSELENTTYIDPLYTESWLRDFLDYVRRNQDYSPIDISNEKAFIEALNVVSLQKKKKKTNDCLFSVNLIRVGIFFSFFRVTLEVEWLSTVKMWTFPMTVNISLVLGSWFKELISTIPTWNKSLSKSWETFVTVPHLTWRCTIPFSSFSTNFWWFFQLQFSASGKNAIFNNLRK